MAKKPTIEALAERQVASGTKAQEIFEKLLTPEDVICQECGAVTEKAKVSALNFQAAKEVMSAIGLGRLNRTKDESDEMDADQAVQALMETVTSLPQNQADEVADKFFSLLPDAMKAEVVSRFIGGKGTDTLQ